MTARTTSRWLVNSCLLLTGITACFSGFLIQGHYHMGHATSAVWGLGHAAWAVLHQLTSFALLAGVAWHVSLHWRPLLAYCTREPRWRRLGFWVVVVFLLSTATALAAWIAFMAFGHRTAENALVEIHDKVAIPLVVLLVLHTWQRRSRLFQRRR